MAKRVTRSKTNRSPKRKRQESQRPVRSVAAPRTLDSLGIIGMAAIEPVVLAAIATESPLLLIGAHGTAKSLLLCRLCEALGLTWRHYNASLLNYDDLVGYPLPGEDGQLRFVQTPASIWEAEAVFLDEISRCRVDLQNRLFSIVHERRVQGMPLDRLCHRWAAMNPPVTEDFNDNDDGYAGSEPLDPALADRFNFVVEVPCWRDFADTDRERVIRSRIEPVSAVQCVRLRENIDRIVADLVVVEEALGDAVAEYVRIVFDQLIKLGLPMSGRRAAMLYRNIIAVHAARQIRLPAADPGDSAWLALEHSLPQRGQGVKVDRGRLLIAHNEVWQAVQLEKRDLRRLLVVETDPVKRAIKATAVTSLSMQEYSAYVADGLAEAKPGAAQALAVFVLGADNVDKLIAAVAEQAADLYATVTVAQDIAQGLRAGSDKHKAWQTATAELAKLPANEPETGLITNLLAALFNDGTLSRPEDVNRIIENWSSVRRLCDTTQIDVRHVQENQS